MFFLSRSGWKQVILVYYLLSYAALNVFTSCRRGFRVHLALDLGYDAFIAFSLSRFFGFGSFLSIAREQIRV